MLKKIDFRTVDLTATKPEADANLTFGEVACAWVSAVQNFNDETRLRKWTQTFGDRSAWSITSDELGNAVQAMVPRLRAVVGQSRHRDDRQRVQVDLADPQGSCGVL